MKQLRIYFKNQTCDDIEWCFVSNQTEPQFGDALAPPLPKLALSAQEVIFIVPQFLVYETRIAVADKNAKQLLSAAAYQLEDELAEDVEDLHFAQGNEQNGVVPFVAISHEFMRNLIAFEKQNNINATYIVNELALCPDPKEGEVNILLHQQHYLFKAVNPAHNSVCPESQIDFFIKHYASLHTDVSPNRLPQSVKLLTLEFDLSRSINLKQKTYSNSHVWQIVLKSFALPLALIVLLAAVYLFNLWQDKQELQQQVTQIKAQQTQLIKRSLGDKSSTNPKTALIKALQKQQGTQKQNSFIAVFDLFLKAKQGVAEVKLVKVDYKNDKLLVDVTAKNLQQLDQLIVSLKNNFKVTVSQMDSSNNESQGRFILEQR